MSRKLFTDEEIAELRENPYVKKVNERIIVYTERFKEQYRQEYKAGRMPGEILSGMGFDLKVLGPSRINGISQRIREGGSRKVESEGNKKPREATKDNRIAYLEHEVEYLRQTVDFLKKISELEEETRQKAQLKRKRGTNSVSSKE